MSVIPTKEQVNSALAFFHLGQRKTENPFSTSNKSSFEKSKDSNILGTLNEEKALEHFEKAQELFEKAEEILTLFGSLKDQGVAFKEQIESFNAEKESFAKAMGNLGELQASFEHLTKDVEKISNTPKPRKSFTNIEEVERFEKSKGGEGTTLSISQHKAQISDILFAGSLEKGGKGDPILMNAVMQLEGANSLPIEALKFLSTKKINIVQ